MYTDVYVDVLFLINFAMDGIALYITARLCALRVKVLRMAVASSLGALYCVASVFFELRPLLSVFVTVLVCLVMVCIAFPADSPVGIIKYSGVMFVASSLIGGVMSALYSMLQDLLGKYITTAREGAASPVLFAVLACISVASGVFLTRLHGSGSMPDKAEISVALYGKEVKVQGIVDSGNLLKDPLSGKNVILIRAECLTGMLSVRFLSGAARSDMNTPYMLEQREKARFRLIPAKGIGGGVYLYGFIPERICINYQKGKKTVTIERDAVMAVAPSLEVGIDCVIPQSIL